MPLRASAALTSHNSRALTHFRTGQDGPKNKEDQKEESRCGDFYDRENKLVMHYQVISPDNIHERNVICTEQVVTRNVYV